MQLPSYFLPQPAANWDTETTASFEQLFREAVEPGAGAVIDYTLAAPKWQFLCYLCDHKKIVLHGSGKMDIAEFEPRQSNDSGAGARRPGGISLDGRGNGNTIQRIRIQ